MTNHLACASETREEATPETCEETEDGQNERDDAHLRDVEVGAGCTEIWEHLAEQREE